MSVSCTPRRRSSSPPGGHQQLTVTFEVRADPGVIDVAAAQVLMFLTDELRTCGVAVDRVRLEVHN
jgi:hypothetical protein